VDVRHVVFRLARRTSLGHRLSFCDDIAAPDEQRPKVRQRCPVAVAGGNRHRQPVSGHLPGERNLTRRRSSHSPRIAESDVDASMLSGGVRVVRDRESA
jgi:hypothetical protein